MPISTEEFDEIVMANLSEDERAQYQDTSWFPARSSYRIFRIPKRSGKLRTIEEPNPTLKNIQRGLVNGIMALGVAPSTASHAFCRNKSIKTMAAPHVGKRWLIKVDLADFFQRISSYAVTFVLRSDMTNTGYDTRTSRTITERVRRLCFPSDRLPTGAPTSPILSNIFASRSIDPKMVGFCSAFHVYGQLAPRGATRFEPIFYSRYADDLCFSSDYPDLPQGVRYIVNMLNAIPNVRVNEQKIKVISNKNRREVCGVVVNDKTSKSKRYRKELRRDLHRAIVNMKHGRCPVGYEYLHRSSTEMRRIDLRVYRGKVNHVNFICPEQAAPLKRQLEELEAICSGRRKV